MKTVLTYIGFAVLYMRNGPVNSLSSALSKEIRSAILELEGDPDVHGVIFASVRFLRNRHRSFIHDISIYNEDAFVF